ncbi:YqcC family protein [Alishewanella sp. SMS8]|uniref:YqcC family protein n=1 Tax=Alishewanella sp. SMS8 TaxID=2994676 RepID=UPI00274252E1|nr:YqcC family protein [Alishewanella sp. SMS8]MDP5206359.1 YqcC family protein [Alishewanella sp. SMS9]MDP5458444.1 YqcC family protein [Alishewanella sp. SMS8]
MSQHLSLLLADIMQALKQAGLYSRQPPSPQAMASSMPFCCDSMPLEQWLQFILIPRLQAMLAAGQPLPNKVAILPMAEQVYAGRDEKIQPLLAAITRLDLCLNKP